MEDMKTKFFLKTNLAIPVPNTSRKDAIELESLVEKDDLSQFPEVLARLQGSMEKLLKQGELPDCGQKALRQSTVAVIEQSSPSCTGCPLAKGSYNRGAMTARLEHNGKVYGLLSANLPVRFLAEPEEVSLFEEVAGDITFALHSMEMEQERKQAEEEISRRHATLSAVNKIFREAMTCENEEQFSMTCLAVAEEPTGGKISYVREVNEKGRLDTIAMSATGWAKCNIPGARGPLLLKNLEVRRIRGRVIKDEKSFLFTAI